MGQKANPIGLRLGIIRGWDSNWYGGKNFGDKILEDFKIREYLYTRLSKAGVSKIVIERTLKLITVTINTARPGIIIGKGGQEVDKLKEELKKLTKKDVQINIFEIKRPELDAKLVADYFQNISLNRGVKHIDSEVIGFNQLDNGDVNLLTSFLKGKAYNVPFIQLFTNLCEKTFLQAPNKTKFLAIHSAVKDKSLGKDIKIVVISL
jgi:hypothetical protein